MASRRGRVVRPAQRAERRRPDAGEYDPYVALLQAMVERSWADLAMPPYSRGRNARATADEQREAAQFLQEMFESACRRSE